MDPVSRKKVVLEYTTWRFSVRSDGPFGRYRERMVTGRKHPGEIPDTYGGGTDSSPFYYERETV